MKRAVKGQDKLNEFANKLKNIKDTTEYIPNYNVDKVEAVDWSSKDVTDVATYFLVGLVFLIIGFLCIVFAGSSDSIESNVIEGLASFAFGSLFIVVGVKVANRRYKKHEHHKNHHRK